MGVKNYLAQLHHQGMSGSSVGHLKWKTDGTAIVLMPIGMKDALAFTDLQANGAAPVAKACFTPARQSVREYGSALFQTAAARLHGQFGARRTACLPGQAALARAG